MIIGIRIVVFSGDGRSTSLDPPYGAPSEVIPTHRKAGRPGGIIRSHLTEEKISEIPILKELLFPKDRS